MFILNKTVKFVFLIHTHRWNPADKQSPDKFNLFSSYFIIAHSELRVCSRVSVSFMQELTSVYFQAIRRVERRRTGSVSARPRRSLFSVASALLLGVFSSWLISMPDPHWPLRSASWRLIGRAGCLSDSRFVLIGCGWSELSSSSYQS